MVGGDSAACHPWCKHTTVDRAHASFRGWLRTGPRDVAGAQSSDTWTPHGIASGRRARGSPLDRTHRPRSGRQADAPGRSDRMSPHLHPAGRVPSAPSATPARPLPRGRMLRWRVSPGLGGPPSRSDCRGDTRHSRRPRHAMLQRHLGPLAGLGGPRGNLREIGLHTKQRPFGSLASVDWCREHHRDGHIHPGAAP